jgi:hypothetical protein
MPVQPFQSQGSLIGFNEYKPNFIGRPVEALGSMIGKFDANNQAILDESNAMDLALSSIDLMPEDRKYLVEQRDKFRQGVQGIIDDENYNLAGARINKMAREFQGNEAIKASLGNKQTFEANRADLKKRYDNGKLDYQAYRRGLDQLYSPTLQDGDGFYSKFVPEEFVNKYDFDSILSKRTANWRPDLKSGPLTHVPATATVPEHYKTTTEEFIRPEQVRSGLETALATDPDAMAYAEQVSRLNPEQYPDAQSVINAQIQSYVDKTALNRKGESYPGFGASLSGSRTNTGIYPPSTETTPGLNIEKPVYINAMLDALEEKPRGGVPVSQETVTDAMGGFDRGNTVSNKPIRGITNLDKDVQERLNNISEFTLGKSISQIDGISDKTERNNEYKKLYDYIDAAYTDAISNNKLQAFDFDKQQDHAQKMFGIKNNVIKIENGKAVIAGNMVNRKIYDPKTNEVYTGTQFTEEILPNLVDGNTGNLAISVNGRLNPNHSVTGLVGGDKNFAVSYQLNTGGKRFIVSGSTDGEYEIENGQLVNITPRYKQLNNIYQAKYQPSQPIPVILGTPNGGTIQTKVTYLPVDDNNGYYQLILPDGTELIGISSEDVVSKYVTHAKNKQ